MTRWKASSAGARSIRAISAMGVRLDELAAWSGQLVEGCRRLAGSPPLGQASVDGAKVLAASRRTWALSVFSQVNSGSERPKWPPLAVLR